MGYCYEIEIAVLSDRKIRKQIPAKAPVLGELAHRHRASSALFRRSPGPPGGAAMSSGPA